ncbi:lipopolysaccharide assembly protein LapA domain-containing protein [Geodermatophilus sp. SYSU D00703]
MTSPGPDPLSSPAATGPSTPGSSSGPATGPAPTGPTPAPAPTGRTTSPGRSAGRAISRTLALALLVFVTVVLVLFVVFNTQTVDVSLVFGNVDAPLVLALLVAAALGGLLVWLAGLVVRARRRNR